MKKQLLAATLSLTFLSTSFASDVSLNSAESPSVFQMLCKPDEAYFQGFEQRNPVSIFKLADGDEILATLKLYFGPDHTYHAHYMEYHKSGKSNANTVLAYKKIKGKYEVTENQELILDGLGHGSGVYESGKVQTVNFKITSPLEGTHSLNQVFEIYMWEIRGSCLQK